LVEVWIVGAELGKEFVTDFVASEGGVGVGRVFAPGLVDGYEEGLDVGAAGVEEGAEDFSFWKCDDGVDGAETFGPCAAEELHEDGLGLVVEGVGGEDTVGVAGGKELREEFVACVAGGLFDGFWVAAGASFGYAGGDVGVIEMEGDVETDAEVFDETLVGVGFRSAKTVVDVDGTEAYAEGLSSGGVGCVEGEEESDGVCSAGDGDADAVARFDVRAIEGELGGHPLHGSCSLVRST
jgi:hypothetical protein